MKKLVIAAVALSIVAAMIFILQPKHQTVPELSIQTLEGQELTHHTFNGKVSLINFWFPSCPGCVTEMPKLIQMAHDYQGKNFQILGIAVPVDGLEVVKEYVRIHQLPFTVAYDEGKKITKQLIQTELYPTSILINQDGKILKTFVGEPDFSKLYQEVDAELAK